MVRPPRNQAAANKFSGRTHLQSRPERTSTDKFSKNCDTLKSHKYTGGSISRNHMHTRAHTHTCAHTHTQKISKESQISESSNTKYNAIKFKEIKLTTDKINMKQKTHKNKQVF